VNLNWVNRLALSHCRIGWTCVTLARHMNRQHENNSNHSRLLRSHHPYPRLLIRLLERWIHGYVALPLKSANLVQRFLMSLSIYKSVQRWIKQCNPFSHETTWLSNWRESLGKRGVARWGSTGVLRSLDTEARARASSLKRI